MTEDGIHFYHVDGILARTYSMFYLVLYRWAFMWLLTFYYHNGYDVCTLLRELCTLFRDTILG